MRRALVLSSESARHPFRASLPPDLLQRKRRELSCPSRGSRPFITHRDVRDFLLSYCASLVAVGAFLI